MKLIAVSGGHFAKVDDADFERLSQLTWHLSDSGYAIRRVGPRAGPKVTVRMHLVVFGANIELDVDHRDGDKLNCQRENLRAATRTLNNANSRPRVGCSSRFKGVAWVKGYGRWWAYINRDGKRKNLGYFDDEIEAALAYNAAAPALFGEFARINVIPIGAHHARE